MACYYPLQAFYGGLRPNGKRRIVFKESERESGSPFVLPCGRCVGCRLERSGQWAMRCLHEAQLHDSNCYLTLTYSDERLPSDRSLCLRHFQLFIKKLRRKYGNGIRFFHCGEYSPTNRRPHYHALIFGFAFDDCVYLKMSDSGYPLYTSDDCDALWGFGHCFIGDVSFDSAAYVARYVIDKITGDNAFEHYTDKDTGVMLTPEYVTMSRRPGIGHDWFFKYFDDVYPSDEVIIKGKEVSPPKYYDSKLEIIAGDLFAEIKAKRNMEAMKRPEDQTQERLYVKEKVKLAALSLFKRK